MTVAVTESGQQEAVTDWGPVGQAAGERSTHHQSNTVDMSITLDILFVSQGSETTL